MEDTKFDVEALRRGHEGHDADLVASLYADDAESMTVDGRNPPSSPRTLRGNNRPMDWWRREMVAGLAASVGSALLVLLAFWLFF
jgi:hypothetical protein